MDFISSVQPKAIHEFRFNHDLQVMLSKLSTSSKPIPVMLLGDYGSGKSALLKTLFGCSSKESKLTDTHIFHCTEIPSQPCALQDFCRKSHRATSSSPCRIVIVDDVDALSLQSQHALRTYIDTFGHEVRFACAATILDRIAAPLVSRHVIIRLPSPTKQDMRVIAADIIEQSGLLIHQSALNIMLDTVGTSIRRLLKHFQKLELAGGTREIVKLETAQEICTALPYKSLSYFLDACVDQEDFGRSVGYLYRLYDQGHSCMDIFDAMFVFLKGRRDLSNTQRFEITRLLCRYIGAIHYVQEDEACLAFFAKSVWNALCKSPASQ